LAWSAAGLLAAVVLPWYALQEGLDSGVWLSGLWSSEDYASGLGQLLASDGSLGGVVYVGGHYGTYCGPVAGAHTCQHPTSRPKLLAVDESSGALLPWNPGANSSLGVFALTGDPRKLRQRGVGVAVAYALLTGVTIAAYTLWDKRAVSVLLIPPIVYEWGANVFRSIILLPQALTGWAEVRAEWAANRTAALAVALLSPLAYMLVLTALAISPVSYVAPAREIGILFGVLMGARSLAEADIGRRSIAAVLMVGGVIALALG